ncbi:MAG: NADH-quinone oxidoreductase subunit L, partial [Thermoplasmata archaeon]
MNNIEIFGFLIFLIPMIAFPITLLAGKLKKSVAGIIATSSIFLSFLLALFIFITDGHNIQLNPVIVTFPWFFNFTFGIYLDSLALVMVLMVSGVSFLI